MHIVPNNDKRKRLPKANPRRSTAGGISHGGGAITIAVTI